MAFDLLLSNIYLLHPLSDICIIDIFYQAKTYWFLHDEYWRANISNMDKSEFCYVGSFMFNAFVVVYEYVKIFL